MPYTDAAKNEMLGAIEPDEVSLHTDTPNASGSNEVTGGGYERQPIEWNAPSSGAMDDKSNGIDFAVPAGATVKFVGFWREGAFKAWDEVTNETFTGAGTYELTDADLDLNK